MDATNSITKTWSYQGDNIASAHSSENPDIYTVYTIAGNGVGAALARHDVDVANDTTRTYLYVYNHRGDVVGVTDEWGEYPARGYEYDAYGNVTADSDAGGAPRDDLLFCGKDLDPATELYYFNARWYDPEIGSCILKKAFQPRKGIKSAEKRAFLFACRDTFWVKAEMPSKSFILCFYPAFPCFLSKKLPTPPPRAFPLSLEHGRIPTTEHTDHAEKSDCV